MKKIFSLLLLIVLLFSLTTTVTIAKDDTLDNILKLGIVKVGFCVDTPPMKFRDKNQEPAGICADFAKALARDLGVKLEYVYSDWAGLIPNLFTGRCDVVIGDMARTLERAKKVNFTDPWLIDGYRVVVRNDSEWKVWQDMNKESVKFGVIIGGLSEQHLKELLPKVGTLTYNSHVEQELALDQGRVDGLLTTQTFAVPLVAQSNGKFRMLPDLLKKDKSGFTLRPDDYHFLIWMNLWLENMIDSGEYDKLMDYWIYSDKWKEDYPEF